MLKVSGVVSVLWLASALLLACGGEGTSDPAGSGGVSEEAALVTASVDGVLTYQCAEGKVLLCHRPGGADENLHPVCVSLNAKSPHEAHPDDLQEEACEYFMTYGVRPPPLPEELPPPDQQVCLPDGEACDALLDCCSANCLEGVCTTPVG